jgi:hypothetical protein
VHADVPVAFVGHHAHLPAPIAVEDRAGNTRSSAARMSPSSTSPEEMTAVRG